MEQCKQDDDESRDESRERNVEMKVERSTLDLVWSLCKQDLMMNRMSGMLTETKDDLDVIGLTTG